MPWKPTPEDWRNIAHTSAELAAELYETEDAEIPDDLGTACARAAELLHQSGMEKMDEAKIEELMHETAVLIGTGSNGWEAAREALKRVKE